MGRYYKIAEELAKEVKDGFPEILDERYYQDRLTEMVDSSIPVYNSDLIDCLADNHNLAEVDDRGLLPENPSVYQIISTAMYEALSVVANEAYDEEAENWEECSCCGEWKKIEELDVNEKYIDERVCDECYNGEYSTCEDCGKEGFDAIDLARNYEETGNRICDECREAQEEVEED